jgi:hypothetical protein
MSAIEMPRLTDTPVVQLFENLLEMACSEQIDWHNNGISISTLQLIKKCIKKEEGDFVILMAIAANFTITIPFYASS